MMNNTNDNGRKVTVSTAAPWTLTINDVEVATFSSRKAAREAAKAAREGQSYDGIASNAHDNVVDAIVADPKAFRKRLGLTRADLAGALKISRYHLDRVEAGKAEIAPDHITELMSAV